MGITGFAFAPTRPGVRAPEQLLLFNGIVQTKTAAVKRRVCRVQEILYTLGMLRDPLISGQNDNENWRRHAEHSGASRISAHDIPFVMLSETKHLGLSAMLFN